MICPCCQTDFPIEAGLNDVAARNAVKRAFSLTPFGDLLLGYVQLFKPAQRSLSMVRLTKLLDELLPMIQAGKIEHKGRIWPAPASSWQMALEQMLSNRDSLALPIKSHGYLLTIIASAADKAEARGEAAREIRGQTGRAQQTEQTAKSAMPEAVRSQLQQFLNKSMDTQGENTPPADHANPSN